MVGAGISHGLALLNGYIYWMQYLGNGCGLKVTPGTTLIMVPGVLNLATKPFDLPGGRLLKNGVGFLRYLLIGLGGWAHLSRIVGLNTGWF